MPSQRLRLVVLALGVSTFTAGAIAGCSSDGGRGTTDDGVSPEAGAGSASPAVGTAAPAAADDSGAPTAPPPANANDVAVYLGQVVALDGSRGAPPDATFAWKIDSAPAGSAITEGDLQSASGPKPTFKPDKVGTYAVTLTVTSHGATSTKAVSVRVFEASVFYNDLQSTTTVEHTSASVPCRPAARTRGRSCAPTKRARTASSWELAFLKGVYGSDWWEAPPGLDSRVVYTALPVTTDAGYVSQLWAATSATSCGSPPTKIDEYSSPSVGAGQFALKVSPDGSRVAYVVLDEGVAEVRTVGFDGSNRHQVAPYLTDSSGTPQSDAGIQTPDQSPLRWKGTQIAWANVGLGDGSQFQIVTAADQDNATPSVLMRCSGTLRTFDFLPNGDVLASLRAAADGGSSAFDLVVLHPNAVTKACEVVHNLTTLTAGSVVHAATLSPDGSRVAYIVSDNSVDAGGAPDKARLVTAAVDASSAPTPVAGVPFGAGYEPLINLRHVAPRWVAGGSALSFRIRQSAVDAGGDGGADYPAVAVVSASGGDVHAVAAGDGTVGHLVSAMGGCNVSRGGSAGFMAFAGLGVFIGLVARRRRGR